MIDKGGRDYTETRGDWLQAACVIRCALEGAGGAIDHVYRNAREQIADIVGAGFAKRLHEKITLELVQKLECDCAGNIDAAGREELEREIRRFGAVKANEHVNGFDGSTAGAGAGAI